MACQIYRNSDNELIVRAENGRPSILFDHLKNTLDNEQEALDLWAKTKTAEFEQNFPLEESLTDENGEYAMTYVLPKEDYLYYGTKDSEARADAEQKLFSERIQEIDDERNKQYEFALNNIKRDSNTYTNALRIKGNPDKFVNVIKDISRAISEDKSIVDAINGFIISSNYYLNNALGKLNKFKEENDPDKQLELLNELSQLLLIFNNLEDIRKTVGQYEKSLFSITTEQFMSDYKLEIPTKLHKLLESYNKGYGIVENDLFTIQTLVFNEIDKRVITDQETKELKDEFTNFLSKKQNLTSSIDEALTTQRNLMDRLQNNYYDAIVDKLWPFIEKGQTKFKGEDKITKEQFKDTLKVAEGDVNFADYGFASLSIVKDPVAQSVRLLADEAIYDAHSKTFSDVISLQTAFKNAGGNKNTNMRQFHDEFLKDVTVTYRSRDINGELIEKDIKTKALKTKYKTEDLERERSAEYKRLYELFEAEVERKIDTLESKINDKLTDTQREKILKQISELKFAKETEVRNAVIQSMVIWNEAHLDVIKHPSVLINSKRKELTPEEFDTWYRSQLYRKVLTPAEYKKHKASKGKSAINPNVIIDFLKGNEVEDAFYIEGTKRNGKVQEYYVYEYSFNGEFYNPIDKYLDPAFKNVENNAYFKEISKVYNNLNSLTGNKLKHGILPQIQGDKSNIQKAKEFIQSSDSFSDKIKKIGSNIKDSITADNKTQLVEVDGVLIQVSRLAQNVDGTIVKTIPLQYVGLLENQDGLETDILGNLTVFSSVTRRYSALSKSEAFAEGMKKIIMGNPEIGISARQVVLKDGKGNPTITNLKKAGANILQYVHKEKGIRINTLINDFLDDVFYGEVEEQQPVKIGNTSISLNKVADQINKWVAFQRLAGNLDSAVSNLIIGKISTFMESVGGRYYTVNDWAASWLETKSQYPDVIKDYLTPFISQKSKNAQIMVYFDAIQGEFSDQYGIKIQKKIAERIVSDALFFSQNGIEYEIQKTGMLSVMRGYKIQLPPDLVYDHTDDSIKPASIEQTISNKNAVAGIEAKYADKIKTLQARIDDVNNFTATTESEIKSKSNRLSKLQKDLEGLASRRESETQKIAKNYFTAHDAFTLNNNGTLVVKEIFQPYFTKDVQTSVRRRIHEINKKLQGNYARMDKTQAQRHFLGKTAMLFRKHIWSSVQNRFGSKQDNYALEDSTEGYQRAFLKKFTADLKEYKLWAFTKLFDGSASPEEQYAINKTGIEYTMLAGFFLLHALLASFEFDDDEPDEVIGSKLRYYALRVADSLADFTLPFGIGNLVKTIKNPFAWVVLIEQVYELFATLVSDPFGVYKRDSGMNEKGDSKLGAKFMKVAPILRQWIKFWTPDDQEKFYTQKRTNV